MNLTEALNVALPDIPVRHLREFRPRIHPKLVGREHVEDGETIVSAIIPEKSNLYRFTRQQWALVNLFDGKRSYEEVAQLYAEQTGIEFSVDEIRDYCGLLDSWEFWYKTPLEHNIALKHKLAEERQQHHKKKSKFGDISHIQFTAWDPDRYLDRILPGLRFIYSRWFTIATFVAMAFTAYIFVTRWSEIGRDTLEFYNFADKNFWDIWEFWWLTCFVLFIHESAHGLTCKYYGGHVHRMGFHLVYLTPAFFTDVTEAWVYASKWQRVATIVWGVWSEMIICAVAAMAWWASSPGTLAHNLSYKLILITGLAVFFFNWNPLIKLDGYYLLTEILGIPDLKEDSTLYVSSWLKKHIWRLPVDVPYVPKRRRRGYVTYALLSGLYSYSLLYVVARFVGNICTRYNPEWGFLGGFAMGLLIFRSRIKTLGRFMKTLYLDKKERLRAWLTPRRLAAVSGILLALLLVPITREKVEARYVLEPVQKAVVRAAVPGTVAGIYADEGEKIAAGAPLARLRDLELESRSALIAAEFREASARAIGAQLKYADYGFAERERQRLAAQNSLLADQVSRLHVTSPISGIVLTPRVRDLVGSYLQRGDTIAEVADLSRMKGRLYVPEHEVRKVRAGNRSKLLPDSTFSSVEGTVVSIAPVSSEMIPALMDLSKYKGIHLPRFFVLTIAVDNAEGVLRDEMVGTAKVYGARRSWGLRLAEPLVNFIARKLW